MRFNLARFWLSSLEFLFAMQAGILGDRSRFPTPPDGEAVEGKGRLSVRRGWRFLRLDGGPYEMGFQQGRLLRPMVGDLMRVYLRSVRCFRWLNREVLLRRGRLMEKHIPEKYLAEMRGVADGAGVSYEEILIGHTFLESMQAISCSAYAAWGKAAGGEMVFGRNLEFFSMGVAQRCGVIAFHKPAGGIPFVSVSWPGLCGALTAVNLRGLCVGLLNVNRLRREPEGQPYLITVRRMVEEAATCEEAVEVLRGTRRSYTNNILIAQIAPAPRAVVAEYSPEEVVVREARPGDEFIAATNHFRKLGREDEWGDERGFARYPALIERLREAAGGVRPDTDIFSDPRIHFPNSLHVLIAAPQRRSLRLSMGHMPAALGPYREVKYDEEGFLGL